MLAQLTRTQIGTLENCPIFAVSKYDVLRIEWVAKLAVCCDGMPENDLGDPCWQAETAYYNNGKFLDPLQVPYIVVPPMIIEGVDPVVLGCQGVIVNLKNGLSTPAICGEVGPDEKLGEASVYAAESIGLDASPNSGGTDEQVILYAIWPGIPAVIDGHTYNFNRLNIMATREEYQKHRERYLAYMREYHKQNWISRCMYQQLTALAFPSEVATIKRREYLKNKQRYRESSRAYKKVNREKLNLLSRLAHRRNPTLAMERQRRWRKNHPDLAREMKSRRRFYPLPEMTPKIAAIYNRAVELCKWFAVEVDHIIPLGRGGQHVPENLQIIYGYENKRKGNSLTYKPKVVFT